MCLRPQEGEREFILHYSGGNYKALQEIKSSYPIWKEDKEEP